jgi:hypothetical protein
MAVKDPNERSEPEKEQIEHGPELYENHGRMMQQVADSTSGQSLGEGQVARMSYPLFLLGKRILAKREGLTSVASVLP